MPCQLEHIISVASLRARRAKVFGEGLRWEERFAVAVAADDVGAMFGHSLPEEAGHVVVTLGAGQFVIACRADGLRYLRVRMQAVQRVFAARERIEDALVIELARDA